MLRVSLKTILSYLLLSAIVIGNAVPDLRAEQRPGLAPGETVSNSLLTEDARIWLQTNPDILLGYPEGFDPGLMRNEDGELYGVIQEYWDLMNERLGTDIKLVMAPRSELFEMIRKKEIAGLAASTEGVRKKHSLVKTEPDYYSYVVVFGKSSEARLSYPEDLYGKKVGVPRGKGTTAPFIKPFESKIELVEFDVPMEALESLQKGRIDYLVHNISRAYQIAKYQMYDITPRHVFWDRPYILSAGIREDLPELASILNRVKDLVSNEEFEALVSKWTHVKRAGKPVTLTPEERYWLKENHTVRVRAIDLPPYLIVKDNQPPQGIVIEYLKLIGERTGVKFKYEVENKPFAEFLESMQQHQGPDMSAFIMQQPGREQYLSFTAPYISSPYVIFIRQGDKLILDIGDLTGKTIAVPRGFTVQELLTNEFPEIRLALFDSDEQALEAVATGKADAYIGNLTVASHIIHQRGFNDLHVVAPAPFGDQHLSMGNRNDWPELTSILDKALASITEEEKTVIRSKYVAIEYGKGINRADVVKWILGIAGFASGIIFLILFWNRSLSNRVEERTNALETSKKSLESEILERKKAEKKLLHLKDQLHEENIYLREEIQVEHNFNEIIGNSAALRYVLFKVEQIAATDTTALILGETGTGKELIAHAIHNTSSRKERPLIRVNCATLPAHLIESELFGHEKGAFTGATVQRIGRFELADGATLFLDEIGEMPLELQPKLLRVLQDGEFERVGSSRTIKVDVRLIAATNRDLETEIKAGRFRQDLFYRLNVYSLTLPPLRERPEDITLLVDTFIKKYNKKLGKHIELISNKTTDALMAYSWPGNIRELQNVIEHAVIIAQDKTLRVELPETQTLSSAQEPTQTLDEMERDYIQEVLTLKNWRIDGPEGAALVLDLKPSTLRSRMQKLGIKRPS